jgi:hypothetical protein
MLDLLIAWGIDLILDQQEENNRKIVEAIENVSADAESRYRMEHDVEYAYEVEKLRAERRNKK